MSEEKKKKCDWCLLFFFYKQEGTIWRPSLWRKKTASVVIVIILLAIENCARRVNLWSETNLFFKLTLISCCIVVHDRTWMKDELAVREWPFSAFDWHMPHQNHLKENSWATTSTSPHPTADLVVGRKGFTEVVLTHELLPNEELFPVLWLHGRAMSE